MRILKCIGLVLVVLVLFAYAPARAQSANPNVIPTWLGISRGIWAASNPAITPTSAATQNVFAWGSFMNTVNWDAQTRFLNAMQTLHDRDPYFFDQVMANNHLYCTCGGDRYGY